MNEPINLGASELPQAEWEKFFLELSADTLTSLLRELNTPGDDQSDPDMRKGVAILVYRELAKRKAQEA